MTDYSSTADTIIRLFQPSNVLHLGCTDTRLIEQLIIKGVPAFGLTTYDVDYENIADDIADRIFVLDSLVSRVFLPTYDLIVADSFIENVPQEDWDVVKLFVKIHGDRHYFRVNTTLHGGKHRLEYWEKLFPTVIFDEL